MEKARRRLMKDIVVKGRRKLEENGRERKFNGNTKLLK